MKNRFTSSASEMIRRKKAFQALGASIIVSVTVTGFTLFPSNWNILLIVILFISLLLISVVFFFNRLLDQSKQIQVMVTEEYIERIHAGVYTRYPVSSITGITIKRNIKSEIREIRFTTKTSGSFFINGLNDFRNFSDCISAVVNKNVTITTIREPIDFDHWMFYPVLGSIVGTVSTIFLKITTTFDTRSISYFQSAIALFSATVGVYWLVSKPMTGRYGKKSVLPDIIAGTLMIVAAAYILLISGIFNFFQV